MKIIRAQLFLCAALMLFRVSNAYTDLNSPVPLDPEIRTGKLEGIDVNDPKNYEEILKKLTIIDVKKVAAMFFSKADLADEVFRPKSE